MKKNIIIVATLLASFSMQANTVSNHTTAPLTINELESANVSVIVTTGNTPLNGATVSILQNNKEIGGAIADARGNVTIKLENYNGQAVDIRSSKNGFQTVILHGALLKNEQDVHLFERLAFMARRG